MNLAILAPSPRERSQPSTLRNCVLAFVRHARPVFLKACRLFQPGWSASGANALAGWPALGLALGMIFAGPLTSQAQVLSWGQDVGAVGAAGTSSYDAPSQTYTLTGAGAGIGGAAYAFHFAYYQAVCGDGSLVVRLGSADANAQAAVVLRASLDGGGVSASAIVGAGTAQFVRRTAAGGGSAVSDALAVGVPCWLKVVRQGDQVSAYASPDRQAWTSLGSDTVPLGASTFYVGLAVSNGVSDGSAGIASATFDSLKSRFLPAEGLQLWLRADEGVTQDASGRVTAWSDASGYGNDASAYVGNAPTWVPGGVNGQPALHFDGSSSYLQLPPGFSDFTRGLSALVVARPASTAPWQRFFDFGNGTPSDNLLLARSGGSNDLIYDAFSGGGLATSVTAPGALALGACELLEAVHDPAAGTVTLFKNAVQAAQSGAAPVSNAMRLYNFIGKSNWSFDPLFSGDIAEVVLFNHALSADERQLWEQYLTRSTNTTRRPPRRPSSPSPRFPLPNWRWRGRKPPPGSAATRSSARTRTEAGRPSPR